MSDETVAGARTRVTAMMGRTTAGRLYAATMALAGLLYVVALFTPAIYFGDFWDRTAIGLETLLYPMSIVLAVFAMVFPGVFAVAWLSNFVLLAAIALQRVHARSAVVGSFLLRVLALGMTSVLIPFAADLRPGAYLWLASYLLVLIGETGHGIHVLAEERRRAERLRSSVAGAR